MRKADLVQALHNGMEKAVVDYHDWSGGGRFVTGELRAC